MCNFYLKLDISNYNYLTLEEKEVSEHRYKLYYYCKDLYDRDKYIGNPYGIGYKTLAEAAEELKRYLENDR